MQTTTFGHHYTARNMAALRAPMPKLTTRPACQVLGWTAAQMAAFTLQRDRNNLTAAETRLAGACASLGQANRHRYARRQLQAQAMRAINAARRLVRLCRAALAASLAAAEPTTPAA